MRYQIPLERIKFHGEIISTDNFITSRIVKMHLFIKICQNIIIQTKNIIYNSFSSIEISVQA